MKWILVVIAALMCSGCVSETYDSKDIQVMIDSCKRNGGIRSIQFSFGDLADTWYIDCNDGAKFEYTYWDTRDPKLELH